MKKKGILNQPLSRVLAGLGHTDLLVICDGGFNVPLEVEQVDLAIVPNLPRFFDVLDAILDELVVEKAIVPGETPEVSPHIFEGIKQRLGGVEIELLPNLEFKKLARSAKAVVRTGEFTAYSNIILQCGVPYA